MSTSKFSSVGSAGRYDTALRSNFKDASLYQSRIDPNDAWLELLKKIQAFNTYQDDWNGDGALAPSPETIHEALELGRHFRSTCCPIPDLVFVSDSGYVVYEWHTPESIRIVTVKGMRDFEEKIV